MSKKYANIKIAAESLSIDVEDHITNSSEQSPKPTSLDDLLKLMNHASKETLLKFADILFAHLMNHSEIAFITKDFASSSIGAMEHLSKKNLPNTLYKLANILCDGKIDTSRMPWGLIQYQIDFFHCSHIKQVTYRDS